MREEINCDLRDMKISGWSLIKFAAILEEFSSRSSVKTGGQPWSVTPYRDFGDDRSRG